MLVYALRKSRLRSSGGSRGRVWGGRVGGGSGPAPPLPPSISPDACFRLKFSKGQDRISLFNWLTFLMKHVLHFATKLNSRDITNCNCFWVP